MDVVIRDVAGLDVHEASVVACVIIETEGRRLSKEIRTFGTMRADLVGLREWLHEKGVKHVVMEGTGVYWRPVYEMLEDIFDMWLVNARHVKNVPGRKSDVIDCEWLARLLRSGMVRKSFVPAPEIRALRDLTRYRRMLVQSQTAEKNRIIKLIEMMGVKLAAVASDVFGASGMSMLRAIAEGQESTDAIAQHARGKLRQKLPELRRALDCTVSEHHRMMLRDQLARLDATSTEVDRYDNLLRERVKPYAKYIELLRTIPGIQETAAIEIFAEVGPDLSSFPAEGNFAAWAGTSPGLHESAGKKKHSRRRRGNPYLTSILNECAHGAVRKKGTYLGDKYRRLKARRPQLVALFAIANKLAHAIYRAIRHELPYHDLGDAYLDSRNKNQVARALVSRLKKLGIDKEVVAEMLAS